MHLCARGSKIDGSASYTVMSVTLGAADYSYFEGTPRALPGAMPLKKRLSTYECNQWNEIAILRICLALKTQGGVVGAANQFLIHLAHVSHPV
eukprot:scaffold13560_cov24-Prasinocladus_malaysianus.AAC.1